MNERAVILIVDDEIHIINALKRIFCRMDCEILSATCPEDAISIINNSKFDIIICDYKMPNISGIDVLRHSKKVMPHAARVLMTGYSDINIVKSAVNEGSIFYYISKPWSTDELISMMRLALENRRSMMERADLNQVLNDGTFCLAEVISKLRLADKLLLESDDPKLPLEDDENIHLVNRSDILYLTASAGDVLVFTVNGQYRSRESLNSWNKKLDMRKFFRCHRSYIVNIERIEIISPWFNGACNIKLKDCKDIIPVSRKNVKALKDILGI